MSVSDKLLAANNTNPKGFYEDTEILEIHKTLYSELDAHPVLPLPADWLNTAAAKQAKSRLKKVLSERLSTFSTWGFKDPRTTNLLPLWNRILNLPNVVPHFILAVRDPESVAVSLQHRMAREGEVTELQWLHRVSDALHYTAANCFIVHYEDWFTRPHQLAQDLLTFTGLEASFEGDLDAIFDDVIAPSLNRSIFDTYDIQNRYVKRLYKVLKECRGTDFERELLMKRVEEARAATNEFAGWYTFALEHIARANRFQERATVLQGAKTEATHLRRQVAKLEKDARKFPQLPKDAKDLRLKVGWVCLSTRKSQKAIADEFDISVKDVAAYKNYTLERVNILLNQETRAQFHDDIKSLKNQLTQLQKKYFD